MKILFFYISFLTLILAVISCQNDESKTSQEKIIKNDTLTTGQSENKIPVIKADTTLFNPYYKPFYGGLTFSDVYALYRHNNTASGPGNPMKMDCYPEYRDSGQGTYHYLDLDGLYCNVSVSLWHDGFYDDTNSRINSVLIFNKNCKIAAYFPYRVGQKIYAPNDSVKQFDAGIYLYKKDDYEFYLKVISGIIKAVYIKRLYCKEEIINRDNLNGQFDWALVFQERQEYYEKKRKTRDSLALVKDTIQ